MTDLHSVARVEGESCLLSFLQNDMFIRGRTQGHWLPCPVARGRLTEPRGKYRSPSSCVHHDPLDPLHPLDPLDSLDRASPRPTVSTEVHFEKKNPIKKNSETKNVPVLRNITIEELIQNTKGFMGDKKFNTYDAFLNNCQDFVQAIL